LGEEHLREKGCNDMLIIQCAVSTPSKPLSTVR
jgi:hypothetical protein